MHIFFWFLFWPFFYSYSPCWPKRTPHNFCHIFVRIVLKLCRMFCNDLRMCIWFWILIVIFLTKLRPFVIFDMFFTSFFGLIWNFVNYFLMIWRCEWFETMQNVLAWSENVHMLLEFNCYIFDKVMALYHFFGIFPTYMILEFKLSYVWQSHGSQSFFAFSPTSFVGLM